MEFYYANDPNLWLWPYQCPPLVLHTYLPEAVTFLMCIFSLMWITASLHICKEWWICHHYVQETHKTLETVPSVVQNEVKENLSLMRLMIGVFLGFPSNIFSKWYHNHTIFHFIVLFSVWYQYNSGKINDKNLISFLLLLFKCVCVCLSARTAKTHHFQK